MTEGWGLQQYEREYWKDAYWKTARSLCQMNNAYVRSKDLEKLNQWQAGRIAELEFYLRCIHFKGDTVYINYKDLIKIRKYFVKPIEDEPLGLSSSRYVRDT